MSSTRPRTKIRTLAWRTKSKLTSPYFNNLKHKKQYHVTVIISQGASKCLACRQNIVLCCHDHKRDVRKKIFTKTAAICTNALYIKNISVEIQQKLRRLVLAPTSVLSNESQTCNTRKTSRYLQKANVLVGNTHNHSVAISAQITCYANNKN